MLWLKRQNAVGNFWLVVLALIVTASGYAQYLPPEAKLRLTRLDFEGLQAQKPETVSAILELKVGQTVDADAIKAAALRLSKTAMFEKVAYRYRFSTTIIELTFELVEKTTGKRPCQFDNFVWFSDQELIAAVKRDLPGFDGTMVVSDYVGEEIKKLLTRFLREKKLSGEVVFETDENLAYLFKIKDANLKVCETKFVGASAELLEPLREAAQSLLKTEYSKSDARLYARAALIPVYRQRGFLKARFSQPQSSLNSGGECANAVVVSLPVEEGLQYRWDKAVWTGNQAFSTQQLDRGLKLKSGEVANLMMIEGGWSAVNRIFGSRGYLRARLKPEQAFDDARQLVSYQVTVTEGPQYKMGEVTIAGLPDADAKKVKDAWQLAAGEVFDLDYGGIFLSRIKREGLVKFKNVNLELKRDDEKLAANLTLKFEQ